MYKQIHSKRRAVRACLCAGFVSAALLSALVLSGCGGDKNSTGTNGYTLTTNINPSNSDNKVFRDPDKKIYEAGDTVALKAVATYQQKFAGWSGAQLPDTHEVTIIMNGNKNITAYFKPYYLLNVVKEPAEGGNIIKNPDKTEYVADEKVTVTAEDTPGYTFTHWSGASDATTKSVTVTISKDDTLTAHFLSIYIHSLDVRKEPANGGSVNKAPDRAKYEDGERVTLTAAPAEDYKFAGWSGASEATTAAVTITMDGDKTLTAKFKTTYLTLEVKTEPASGGTVSYDRSKTRYAEGDVVILTATAAYSYDFVGWYLGGALASTDRQLNYEMSDNTVLTAKFQNCTANLYAEGCPAYNACLANPVPGCPNYVDPDQCAVNPVPGCPNYCDANPTTKPGCPGYVDPGTDPCIANFTPECPGYCTVNSTAPECVNDPCAVNPTPECPGYCTANPTALECVNDPCVTSPTPSCPGYCAANPGTPGCPPADPCATADSLITPGCSGYCPPEQPGCPGYNPPPPDNKWCYKAPTPSNSYQGECFQIAGPNCTQAYCQTDEACTAGGAGVVMTQTNCNNLPITGNDPCAIAPAPSCPNYCQVYPNEPGCTTPVEKKWCYWAPNQYNEYNGGCSEIGGAYCDSPNCQTVAGCTASSSRGEVITSTTACNGLPTTGTDPCIDNSTAPGCGSGSGQYCRFDGSPDKCYKLPTADHATPAECWEGWGEVVDSCDAATIGVYCRWSATSCTFTLGYKDGYASGNSHCVGEGGMVVESCP